MSPQEGSNTCVLVSVSSDRMKRVPALFRLLFTFCRLLFVMFCCLGAAVFSRCWCAVTDTLPGPNVNSRRNETILTVRVVVSHQLHCTGPETGVCSREQTEIINKHVAQKITTKQQLSQILQRRNFNSFFADHQIMLC